MPNESKTGSGCFVIVTVALIVSSVLVWGEIGWLRKRVRVLEEKVKEKQEDRAYAG